MSEQEWFEHVIKIQNEIIMTRNFELTQAHDQIERLRRELEIAQTHLKHLTAGYNEQNIRAAVRYLGNGKNPGCLAGRQALAAVGGA